MEKKKERKDGKMGRENKGKLKEKRKERKGVEKGPNLETLNKR